MQLIFQIVIAVLVFGLLIFVHELGHFSVAKWSGMRVNEFALGMGPALVQWRKGETNYALRAFPVGGYVMVEGEDEESPDPRSFGAQTLWKRMLFVFAGAFMNLLLGFVLLSILVSLRSTLPTMSVGGYYEGFAPGDLQVGDQITSVNGSRVFTVNDISFSLTSDRDGIVDFTVLRNGQTVQVRGVDFGMEVMDDGTRMIRPGFYVAQQPMRFWSGAKYTLDWMLSIIRQVWMSFVNLITGNFKLSEMSGPVGVSTAIGKVSIISLEALTNMVAFITVNIGVFNLLPIPALDGGRLLFLFIELIFRRRVPARFEGAVHAAGLVALLGLVVVISFQDIMRLF